MDISFVARGSEPIENICAFYKDVGYGGGATDLDKIFLCRSPEQIIGSVRICSENESLVLRGMYFLESHRGKKLGKQLLHLVEDYLDQSPLECYCVPYNHLTKFYGLIGFKEISPQEAPVFLAERISSYREQGLRVTLMKREPKSL